MRPYSTDLRERIVAAVDRGQHSLRQIAQLFCVNLSFLVRLLQRRRTTGSVQPEPHRGGPTPKLDAAAVQRLRPARGAGVRVAGARVDAAEEEVAGGAPTGRGHPVGQHLAEHEPLYELEQAGLQFRLPADARARDVPLEFPLNGDERARVGHDVRIDAEDSARRHDKFLWPFERPNRSGRVDEDGAPVRGI